MFQNLKSKKLILIVVVILALLALITFVIIGLSQNLNLKSQLERHIQSQEARFKSHVENDTRLLGAALELLNQDQALKEIYLKKDREKLYQYSWPLFQDLKEKYGISHFYFILPDATVFLRMHKKDIYGDLVKRASFKQAKETRNTGTEIELGKTAFAVRVVRPYFDQDRVIGYVEFAEDLNVFTEILKKETNDEVFIAADKKYLDREDWKSLRGTAGLWNNWDDLPQHVILNQTPDSRATECLSEINFVQAEKGPIVLGEIKEKDKYFSCGGFPILDSHGLDIGVFIIAHDLSNPRSKGGD